MTSVRSRCLPSTGAVRMRVSGGSGERRGSIPLELAARISASDQTTITAHRATASQTITCSRYDLERPRATAYLVTKVVWGLDRIQILFPKPFIGGSRRCKVTDGCRAYW